MRIEDIGLPEGMAGHVDHIGIAVEDLEESIALYKGLLGLELDGIEEVPREKLRVAFLRLNNASPIGHIELLESQDPESNVGKFIAKKGAGLHHVAFAAADMEQALENCRRAGLRLLNEEPLPGAHGKSIVFAHPKSTGGVLVEICAGGH
ncbi:MAG TPA: methylmalonyl-CoA epimerase [Candidatus Krumholzibacteria bacterium]|nr:methylmalonyl-CoA epimerase [Candidatus Krumholzibacteria bacterium]HRX50149.1 methylmalonyl-CoA epimerase [Candidatus Krumholzibacteria bacterium]